LVAGEPRVPARGPPTDSGEIVREYDDRNAIKGSPDDLPTLDIHSF